MMERKVDELGRVVLPAEYRNTLGLTSGCSVLVEPMHGTIVIKPATIACKLCGSLNVRHKRLCICEDCINVIICYDTTEK